MLLIRAVTNQVKSICNNQSRSLFGQVYIAFNRVDPVRLQQIGPDRMCAEWVLKNGGAVSFTIMPNKFLRDYNSLPPENVKITLAAIDATDSSIMKIGFDHLIGCKRVEKILLNNCKYLEEDGLTGLQHAKDNLTHLEISGCNNITDSGLQELENLKNLRFLKISEMQYVRDLNKVKVKLQESLKDCQIVID